MEPNLDEVWRILKSYKFEFVNKNQADFLCLICKSILINSSSGPCGCRFCFECIDSYLNKCDKFCPGISDECNEEMLNMSKNIHIEPRINRNISKLIVKCPEVNCKFTDELRKIETHIRLCDSRKINCPFYDIGCEQSDLIIKDMKTHLLSDIMEHSNLLFKLIDNMKNEIQIISAEYKARICELERKEQISCNKIDLLNQEIVLLNNQNESMKNEIKNLKIYQLNEISDNQISIKYLQEKISVIEKSIVRKSFGEFKWEIGNISEWKTDVYSDPFYSHRHGYKMCLSVIHRNHVYSFNFHLMRGKFDDDLPWPCNCDVTVDLINLYDNKIYMSKTIKYDKRPSHTGWDRPSSEKNTYIEFLSSSLSNLREKSNKMLVKCTAIAVSC